MRDANNGIPFLQNTTVLFRILILHSDILIITYKGRKYSMVEWIICPNCGGKTRNKIRVDTILKNFPLYCPKCKQEYLIDVQNLCVVVVDLQRQKSI